MSAGLLAAPAWVPAPPLPGTWTFWADTSVGFTSLGPVAPVTFTYSQKLSDFGTADAVLPLSGTIDPATMRRLWSWRLWAFYAGLPVWAGCPTGIRDSGGAAIGVTFMELPGYLKHRVLDAAVTYTATEQTWIGYQIAQVAGDIGVTVATNQSPGQARDRQYQLFEGPTRGDLLVNLSQVIGGPQFRAEYAMKEGLPTCTLMIAHPSKFGQDTGLGVTIPGAGLAYEADWDDSALRTRTYAVGDTTTSGGAQPVVTVDRPQADLPRLDMADDWAGTVLSSTLTENANAMATADADPGLALTATAPLSSPALTSYRVGDLVTVNIISPLYPNGFTAAGQLTQLTVDAAKGTAQWTVSVKTPAARVHRAVSAHLAALDATVSRVFRRNLPASA